MKDLPILMSAPMVKSTRANLKRMTRRALTKNNSKCTSLLTGDGQGWHSFDFNDAVVDGKSGNEWYLKVSVPEDGTRHRVFCKWSVGDTLWVRESGWVDNNFIRGLNQPTLYWKADYDTYEDWEKVLIKDHCCFFPSIHMYKEFSRIHLEVTGIRVERLQDIKSGDVKDEGAGTEVRQMWLFGLGSKGIDNVYRRSFQTLWESINGEGSWDLNPWVWVVIFKKINHGGK